MLWRAALVASTLCFVTQCLFTSGKECMQDVVLQTAEDVKTFSARNCSVIRGSLFLWGLEPSRSSVGGCYSSRVLQALDLPTIDSVTLITGGLEVYNLFENYRNLSQLLPNLKRVEGRTAVVDGTGYSLVVTNNLFLENIGPLKLERGCVFARNNAKLNLNVAKIVSQELNASLCDVCYHNISGASDALHSSGFDCPEARDQCDTSGWHELNSEKMKKLEGCTYIKGGLVFSGILDVSVKNMTKYFGQVKVVRDYVVVSNNYEWASLSFLSNLTTIKGENLWKNKYALALDYNLNLALLWPGVENLTIDQGQALVHKNTVLCQRDYSNLLQALRTVPTGSHNSLEGFCLEDGLELSVDFVYNTDQDVTVEWSKGPWSSRIEGQYTVTDYEIYYDKVADVENCGVDGLVTNPGHDLLFDLEPDTRYWLFIRSEVIVLNKTALSLQTQEYANAVCFSRRHAMKPARDPLGPITSPSLSYSWDFQQCNKLVVSLHHHESNVAEFRGFIVSIRSSGIYEQYCSDEYSVNESRRECFNGVCNEEGHEEETRDREQLPLSRAFCPCSNENEILLLSVNAGMNSSSFSLLLHGRTINVTFSRNNGDYQLSIGPVRGERRYAIQAKSWLKNQICSVWSNPLVLHTGPIWSDDVATDLEVNGSIQSKPESSSALLIDITWTNPLTPNGILKEYIIVIDGGDSFTGLPAGSAKLWIRPEIAVICKKRRFSTRAICTIGINLASRESQEPYQLSYRLQPFKSPLNNFTVNVTVFTWSSGYSGYDDEELPHTRTTIRFPGNQTLQESGLPQAMRIALTVVSIMCAILLTVVFGYCFVVRKKRIESQGNNTQGVANRNYLDQSEVYVPDKWEVDRENVIMNELLGEGAFGKVCRGLFQRDGSSQTVAIKTCRSDGDPEDAVLFLKEASVMKEFDCEYIVRLLGIVSKGEPALVIMEIMELGDLKTYLRSLRPEGSSCDREPKCCLTEEKVTKMATQIASGMAYLSEKKFVHRDLAARNCMVDSDTTVKIGDFGMTRDIHLNDYYRKRGRGPMPVRWMGPESLRDGIFSHASDVWSYGVVLWEIATLGSLPYPGLSNEEVFQSVGKGNLMKLDELPTFPDLLRKLMKECWMTDPSCRPSFVKILCHLPALEGCEAEV
eukprot:m.182166 g.182166  ORF g.182166 m.182166 type:complete len:1143 (+) comp39289_c0_seq10:59-3487(+)